MAAALIAAPPAAMAVPAGPVSLQSALLELATRTGSEIVSLEPGLRAIRVQPAPTGLSAEAALRRLLRGTGYRAERIGPHSYRVVRVPERRHLSPSASPSREASEAAPEVPEVIVTASKQHVPLLRFPASILTIQPQPNPASSPTNDLTDAVRSTPVLQSTALGPGRNKLFIRGIADSSFNGATQATTSYYLDDVQMSYSTPEPGLALVDVRSVEVMEGPQGTLYGAGAIGGIIRIVPNPAQPGVFHGSIAASGAMTVDGRPGGDLSGFVNLPIPGDSAAVRLVGYVSREGGYIDDPLLGREAINAIDRIGGRASVRIDAGDGWRIDATGLGQRISAGDAQYIDLDGKDLSRSARAAQPYWNSILLGRVSITKHWPGGLEFVSVSGVSQYDADDRFDATPPGARKAIGYTTVRSNLLWTNEVRLSRSSADGESWVVGLAVLRNRDAENRTLGPANDPSEIIGVTNVSQNVSMFGEVTEPLSRNFSATLGLRATEARVDGYPSIKPRAGDLVRGRMTRRIDPTLALSWQLAPDLSVYGRFQSGFRTGGLAVARGVGRVAEFKSDAIGMGEVGLRRLRRGPTGLNLTAALSYARWRDIQADLIDRRGQPYTANIGDAHIFTGEMSADWVPMARLRFDLSALYTVNHITGPLASTSPFANQRLPNTPPISAHAGVSYDWSAFGGTMRATGALDYIGRSVLGSGRYLDFEQGQYAVLSARAEWLRRDFTLWLAADNLTDSRGNRFAFGNPFTLAMREQSTPLRPTTLMLGVKLER
ncbi:TonB-dependent receptor [uncultured Sphingomonas sp.]|uniref:TonB-dependent receptor domain-containing protein n=1 Tax=uncultured Sphingomonas sp. TaxID=158754 RepID=UPI00261C71AC|nr:TonB-dependent receptor [uncultured Sphingomonas sp.]